MSSDSVWPLVVVGAGPTGLTLANLLALYGVEALLIERNESTVQEPRAVSIDDESLRTMQAIGVVERVLQHVVLGYGSDYFTPSGSCFLRVRPTSREYGYPKRSAFRQPVFERQLREFFCARTAGQAGSEARFGTELVDLRQEQDCVALVFRHADGGRSEVSARYLAACDGGRSFVRERLGIGLSGSTFRERWLILDLEETRDPTRDTKVFCDRARPCLSLPGPDRTRRFEFMLHDGENEPEVTSPAFTRALLKAHGEENTPIRRSRVYTFHARMADRWRDGRIFLAGDAAHLSPPFAGQGMNSGIRDAHNLAWKLAAVIQGQLGPRLLETYEEERRPHAWEMIQLAMRMGKVMMPRSSWSAFGLQAAFRLLDLVPPARNYFAEMKYKPKPRFASGFLASTGTRGAAHLIGRLFPQPKVGGANGVALLDEFLGDGFALLSLPQTSPKLFDRLPANLGEPLRTRRVAIRNPGDAAAVPDGIVRVEVPGGVLSGAINACPPGLLLLRPDRYVAAFLRDEEMEKDIQALNRLISGTWDGRPRGEAGLS
jgi:3-(3-hydroxy-phenyl)propionate hydroxylase